MSEVLVAFRKQVQDLDPSATVKVDWGDAAKYVVSNWRNKVCEDLVDDPPRVRDAEVVEPGVKRFFDYVAARRGSAHLEQVLRQFREFESYTADLQSQEPGSMPFPLLTFDPQWDASRYGNWQVKAYGTTLLGVLIGPESLHWLQLGDGAMVKIAGGQADYLVAPSEEAIANETPSLCDDDVVDKIRLGTVPMVADGFPSAIILTTDGIPNSYEERAGFFKFCLDITDSASTVELVENLKRWLPEISKRGSGDDMSVAMAWTEPTAESPAAGRQAARSLLASSTDQSTVQISAEPDSSTTLSETQGPDSRRPKEESAVSETSTTATAHGPSSVAKSNPAGDRMDELQTNAGSSDLDVMSPSEHRAEGAAEQGESDAGNGG